MGWRQNPETGESYQVPDGPSTDAGSPDPYAKGKPKPAVFGSAAPALNPTNPNNKAPPLPPVPQAPVASPVQPIALQGGKVSYNPTTAPFGMDMTTPGVGEQFWNNNQGMWFDSPSLDWVDQQLPQFQSPWAGEQAIGQTMGDKGTNHGAEYWEGIRGAGNTQAEQRLSAGYNAPNLARSAFGQTQSALPGSLQPQFDAYYDRMSQKAMSNVNSQSAARGAYGSNSALNSSVGAGLDVEAQRAKAATDFSLEDSANQRDWFSELGNQGRAADQSGVDIFGANKDAAQYGLDKTKTMGDLAFRADDTQLNRDKFGLDKAQTLDEMTANRLGAGVSTAFGSDAAHRGQLQDASGAANTSQDQREGRVNTLYSQLSGFSSDVQNFMTSNYDQLIGSDGQLDTNALQSLIAQTADERGWDQQEQERIFRDASEAAKLLIKATPAGQAAGAAGGG